MTRLASDVLIEHAIMHELDKEHSRLLLADREIDLDAPAKKFLARLLAHCMDNAQAHALDMGQSRPIAVGREVLACPSMIVQGSRELAEKLYGAMVGKENISSGDLFIVIGTDKEGAVLAIFKTSPSAEYARTYRMENDGTVTPVLTVNSTIIPSEHRPPQKCAFIRQPSLDREFDVLLLDNQVKEVGDVAKYFYKAFLECELVTTSAARTLAFCRAAESWRRQNRGYLPAQGIPSFTRALQVHLLDTRRTEVVFRDFAQSALSSVGYPSLKPNDLAQFVAAKVFPDRQRPRPDRFRPHIETAEKLLSTVSLSLDGAIQISGPAMTLVPMLENASIDGSGALQFTLEAASLQRNFRKPGSAKD